MIQEHSKDGALSQVLRVTLQITEDVFDGGHQAVHDVRSRRHVEPRLRAMGEGAGALLLDSQSLFLHHPLLDVGSTITNVLKVVG